jgi:hypothetical protein
MPSRGRDEAVEGIDGVADRNGGGAVDTLGDSTGGMGRRGASSREVGRRAVLFGGSVEPLTGALPLNRTRPVDAGRG